MSTHPTNNSNVNENLYFDMEFSSDVYINTTNNNNTNVTSDQEDMFMSIPTLPIASALAIPHKVTSKSDNTLLVHHHRSPIRFGRSLKRVKTEKYAVKCDYTAMYNNCLNNTIPNQPNLTFSNKFDVMTDIMKYSQQLSIGKETMHKALRFLQQILNVPSEQCKFNKVQFHLMGLVCLSLACKADYENKYIRVDQMLQMVRGVDVLVHPHHNPYNADDDDPLLKEENLNIARALRHHEIWITSFFDYNFMALANPIRSLVAVFERVFKVDLAIFQHMELFLNASNLIDAFVIQEDSLNYSVWIIALSAYSAADDSGTSVDQLLSLFSDSFKNVDMNLVKFQFTFCKQVMMKFTTSPAIFICSNTVRGENQNDDISFKTRLGREKYAKWLDQVYVSESFLNYILHVIVINFCGNDSMANNNNNNNVDMEVHALAPSQLISSRSATVPIMERSNSPSSFQTVYTSHKQVFCDLDLPSLGKGSYGSVKQIPKFDFTENKICNSSSHEQAMKEYEESYLFDSKMDQDYQIDSSRLKEICSNQAIHSCYPNSEAVVKLEGVFMSLQNSQNNAIVMPVQKSNLTQYLQDICYKRKESLNEMQIASILFQILSGVDKIHALGMIHRDLNPNNIMVSKNSTQFVIHDFGSVICPTAIPRPLETMITTLGYRAPEVCMKDPWYSSAIDIWSVGCIATDLVRNFFPFFYFVQHDTKERIPVSVYCRQFYKDSNLDPFQLQERENEFQLQAIFQRFGTPTVDEWEEVEELPGYPAIWNRFPRNQINVSNNVQLNDLISKMFIYDPRKRITAAQALRHPFFAETLFASNNNK